MKSNASDRVGHVRKVSCVAAAPKATAARYPGVVPIVDRSIFHLKAVLQDIGILEEHGWQLSEDLRRHVRLSHQRVLA